MKFIGRLRGICPVRGDKFRSLQTNGQNSADVTRHLTFGPLMSSIVDVPHR